MKKKDSELFKPLLDTAENYLRAYCDGKQSDDEKAMLEFTASERKPNSRLSCQLVATPEFEGLVVYLPETQV